MQHPANAQGIQFNDMYGYVSAGTAGAGLPRKKRLQVNQAPLLPSGQSDGTQTLNLDAAYTYNNEGSVLSTTYPTTNAMKGNGILTAYPGPAYTYSFDNMYRPAGLTTSSSTVVSGVSYGPSNQLLGMTYNGISETRTYNPLLQLTSVSSSSVNMQYNYPAGPNNNGKACLATDLITGEQVVYSYDTLNRLASANAYTYSGTLSQNCSSTSSTATWTEMYTFDGYGNLTNKLGSGGAPALGIATSGTNNQITNLGASYDANGNLQATSGASYTYDPENRMIGVSALGNGSATYGYDSQNKRIWNWSGSTDQYGKNASGYSVYYYGVKGERLGVYNFIVGYYAGSKSPVLENATTSNETYFGARRLAPLDRLGSARSVNGGLASYYPFGEDKSTNPTGDAWRFGTYWRDSISGLDYATNRYYSSQLGRFMTPDPYLNNTGPATPQSWNHYAYTTNDPVNQLDPSGLLTCRTDPDNASSCQNSNSCDPSDASSNCDFCDTADGLAFNPGPLCPSDGPAPPSSSPLDLWINLGDDVQGTPVSAADRTRDLLWMQQDWAALKKFSTDSQNCLNNLSQFGLTPQSLQSIAGGTKLVNISVLPLKAQSANFNPGADFTAILNLVQTKIFKFVVYNQNNFWQATSSQMAGTLLHEILHLSSVGNFALTDAQIAKKLGVTITPTDDSAISLKLAKDCFPTGN